MPRKPSAARPPAPPPPAPARRWHPVLIYAGLLTAAFGVAYGATLLANRPPKPPLGMVWIPGGEFQMGMSHLGFRCAKDAARR